METDELNDIDLAHKERQNIITEQMTGVDVAGARILEFQKKAPAPPDVRCEFLRHLFYFFRF